MPHAGLTRALLAKAEPVRCIMLAFKQRNAVLAPIIGLGRWDFSKKGVCVSYALQKKVLYATYPHPHPH